MAKQKINRYILYSWSTTLLGIAQDDNLELSPSANLPVCAQPVIYGPTAIAYVNGLCSSADLP